MEYTVEFYFRILFNLLCKLGCFRFKGGGGVYVKVDFLIVRWVDFY